MEREFVDLLTLQTMMKEGLEDLFPDRLWVKAEISSLNVKSNGHCYLELSQSDAGRLLAKVKAVIWRSRFALLDSYFKAETGSGFQAGMSVLVRVQVTYSELYGLTLTIDDADPQYTIGEKELEKRRTIEKLRAEGLLDAQKALSLPLLPYRLAVISARDAAGYGDFCRHLHGNDYGFVFHTELFEATMQGAGAPESIIDAIDMVESAPQPFDALLILRGGGSVLDLACFDDYDLAWRIANCKVPVYTAIGHDKDYHVADMVAFSFVKTPTALADEFIDCFMAEDERISSFGSRLRLAFINKVNEISSRVELLSSRIHGADPRNILSRGYALVSDARGIVLKDVEGVQVGDEVDIAFAKGTLRCRVEEKK